MSRSSKVSSERTEAPNPRLVVGKGEERGSQWLRVLLKREISKWRQIALKEMLCEKSIVQSSGDT